MSKNPQKKFNEVIIKNLNKDFEDYINQKLTNSTGFTAPILLKYKKEIMDFLDDNQERYIRDEWKRDKLGFIPFLELYESKKINKPQQKLFGFEGDYDTHFQALEMLENEVDIIDIPNELISLQDKMKWFENW